MPKHKFKRSVVALMAEEANTEGTHNRIVRVAPNLYLQRRENRSSWLMRWDTDGKTYWMGLGRYGAVADDDVVKLVEKYMEVVRAGGDPRKARDEDRLATGQQVRARPGMAKGPMTFREAARAYLQEHAGRWKREESELRFARMMRQHGYPAFGDVPIAKVDVEHVVAALRPVWHDQHPTALQLLSAISGVLEWAEAKGWRSGGNPARSRTVKTLLGSGVRHEVKHFAAIPVSQMPAFWKRLAQETSTTADILRLQVLCATRPSEAVDARWEEIDLEGRLWTIPGERMKKGKAHRIPLSEPAVEMLKRRHEAAGGPADGLVFPGKGGKPTDRLGPVGLVKKLGFKATAHGMRSSFADWASEVAGAGPDVIERALAHDERSKTVQAYRRSDLLGPRTALMDAWARFLAG